MAQVIVAQRMWQRRDTAAEWLAKDPVLAAGEIGVELGATASAAQRLKVGNGTSKWSELAYFSAGNGRWFTGSGVPSNTIGGDGDMYLRTDTAGQGNVYQKVSNAWVYVMNIRGPQGAQGLQGERGYSAYEIAVQQGFPGTPAQWIASLKGEKGDQGIPGPPGIPSQRRIQIVANTDTGAVLCDWGAYDEIQIHLTANATLTFANALPGQGCILKLRQDATGGRNVTLPASVRYNRLITSYSNTNGPNDGDKIGFQYDDSDSVYDFVSVVPGI